MKGRYLGLGLATWALLGLCATLVGLDVQRSWQERRAALDQARTQAADLASTLAEQAQGVVLAADQMLQDMRERLETDGTSPATLARVRRRAAAAAASIGVLQGFYAFDATGRAVLGAASGQIVPGVADRAFFIDHRDHRGRELRVGAPLRSRATGRWVFPLSRRLDSPDGRFAGVAVAAVDVERMQALYASLDLGRHGAIALLRGDGALLLRYPFIEALLRDRAPAPPALSGQSVTAPSPFDGADRVVASHRLASYPLTVVLGLGRHDILAKWRRGAALHLAGALILAGLVASLGILLLHALRRRHEAELAAAAADSEYRLLADTAKDLIMRVQEGGRRVYASPASRRMLGYTPAELLGRTLVDDIHPDDLTHLNPRWGDPAALGPITYTYRMRRRDGEYLWVEATAQPLPRGPGEPAENLVVVRDITERQRVAARLQEANRLLLRAESIAHIGHWRYEIATGAIFWSDEVYRISGLAPGAPPSLASAIEVYHRDDRAEVAALVERAAVTGEPYRFDARLVRPDGDLRHVSSHGEPEYAEDGCLVALVGTFQDRTEQRALEERLRHKQKLQAIGQLAAGVAHDFNNLLQAVLGGLELIVDATPAGSALHECASVAFTSATRGASLTSQLLSFARKQMLLPRAVAVAPFLAETRELLARTIGPRIEIDTLLEAGLPEMFVDPDHLRTAIIGLATNARQAMPEGGRIRIEARLERQPDPGSTAVVIAVRDTGTGMAAAILGRATEPFFTTRGPGGSGLGLPMVQGFAEQSGGELRLASTPGQGTCAEIVLPLPPGTVVAPVMVAASKREVPRILLVDDVAEVLFATSLFLTQSGLEVTTAESGDAALALLSGGARFDALVTDYAMPGLSGVELLGLAREVQPDLPALIITAFAEVDTQLIARFATVLRKPFRRRELVAAVGDLLGITLETPPRRDDTPAALPDALQVALDRS